MLESKINIALFFGGRSAEHEVSLLSARSIFQAFDQEKYNIFPVAISKNGFFRSLDISKKILFSDLKSVPEVNRDNILPQEILKLLEKEIDLVFPVLHGPFGEDGKIQGFLDVLNIQYVGCDLKASAVGMDKAVMKQIFAYNNIPQSKFEILKKAEYEIKDVAQFFGNLAESLGLPFFIKPANMGSSIGISRVNDLASFKKGIAEAFKYDKKLILESSVEGREIESAVLGNGAELKVSAAGEIISTHDFYDYQAKYEDQSTELIIPADISAASREKIKELSARAFRAVDAEGISRLDFFVNEKNDEILVNEINTMPGFTKFSMYPLLFKESGISYSELLDKLVELALKKDN
ncbi:D-alanine-D-alanine ligase [Halanaerobium saccharolyticum]|uniref:D-alanine--D-alanine ligase n=1 Tax=Halanaerobium saccharolyticum TaxID=43595 RepID=A0A4R6S619_9FIRM|nr:D-alanine-D-alanine ligase [Halanaerobium saccharolyticum]